MLRKTENKYGSEISYGRFLFIQLHVDVVEKKLYIYIEIYNPLYILLVLHLFCKGWTKKFYFGY